MKEYLVSSCMHHQYGYHVVDQRWTTDFAGEQRLLVYITADVGWMSFGRKDLPEYLRLR